MCIYFQYKCDTIKVYLKIKYRINVCVVRYLQLVPKKSMYGVNVVV